MKGSTGMAAASTSGHCRDQRGQATIVPLTKRVPDACRYLGIGRSTLYVLIGEGEIEFIQLCSSTLVLTQSLRSLVERKRKPANQVESSPTEPSSQSRPGVVLPALPRFQTARSGASPRPFGSAQNMPQKLSRPALPSHSRSGVNGSVFKG